MRINLLKGFLLLITMLCSGAMLAQTTVSGKVDSEEGPLPGVNVVVKGTNNGTATDFDGYYSIDNVPADAVLEFSFVGFSTQDVPVNGRTTIDVNLLADAQTLDEVVVIGYGTVKKSDATGAIDAIGAKDITTVNAANPAEVLRGKVAGVQITQTSGEPGAGLNIRVRGNSSIRSGNDPLIVVDGVPLAGGDVSAGGGDVNGLGSAPPRNPLNFINQDDIESINVLKDASSTAIYGSRGANGVILITTKKGTIGKPQFEYSTSMGFQKVSNPIDMMSSEQYAEQASLNGSPGLDHGSRGYDYEDAIFRTANTISHDLSASFSGDDSRTRMSFGYLDQEGIVKETGMQKYTFSLNNSLKAFNEKVLLETNVLTSHIADKAQLITGGAGFIGNLLGSALYWNPTYPIFNDDGSYFVKGTDYLNPVQLLNSYDDNANTTRILASISPTVHITDKIDYKFVFGVDYSTSDRASQLAADFPLNDVSGGTTADGSPAGGLAFLFDVERFNKTFENILTYRNDFSENFSLNALLGYSFYSYEYKSNTASARYFNVNQKNLVDNIEGGKNSDFRASSLKNVQELQSFFARAEMTIFNNLLVNASLRFDGSSKVGENETYGTFPAVGVAYKIFENEDSPVNNLKVRGNWGIVGNQEFGVYSSRAYGRYNNGGLSQAGNSNADLKWETTTNYGIGIDFRLFNNLSGSFDYYHRITEDLIFPQPGASNVPNNAGAATFVNLPGQLKNTGYEISLTWDVIRNEDWSLSLSGNAAFLDNEMQDFPLFIETGGINGQGLTGAYAQIIADKLPLYTYYLNEWRGFDANGNSIYAAADGSDTGLGGASKKVLKKSGLPDTNVGFSLNGNWKSLDFSAAFYGQFGGYIYNNTANALFFKGSFLGDRNVPLEYATANQAQGDPNSPSTRYLESGDFFRFANLNIGYTINGDRLGNYVDRLRFQFSANNLFVITDYSGFDPEVDTNKAISGVNSAGMDYLAYPNSKGFTLGLSVGF